MKTLKPSASPGKWALGDVGMTSSGSLHGLSNMETHDRRDKVAGLPDTPSTPAEPILRPWMAPVVGAEEMGGRAGGGGTLPGAWQQDPSLTEMLKGSGFPRGQKTTATTTAGTTTIVTGVEFSFCKMKKFWRWMVLVVVQQCGSI